MWDKDPNTAQTGKFKIWGVQRNANGTIVCAFIEEEDGNRDNYYGTFQAGSAIEIWGTSPWYDYAQLDDMMNAVGTYTGITDPINAVVNPTQANQTTTSGVADTGNTTDSERLTDIVGNTKATADNLQKSVLATEQVRDSVNNLARILAEKDTGGGPVLSGGGGLTQEQSADATAEGIGEALDARTTSEGDFSGISGEFSGSFQEGDVPVKKSITDTLTENQPSGGPIGGFFTGSRVEASGNCSFTFDYKGKTATFGLCDYQSQLQAMGIVILALAGVYSLLIVLGRT